MAARFTKAGSKSTESRFKPKTRSCLLQHLPAAAVDRLEKLGNVPPHSPLDGNDAVRRTREAVEEIRRVAGRLQTLLAKPLVSYVHAVARAPADAHVRFDGYWTDVAWLAGTEPRKPDPSASADSEQGDPDDGLYSKVGARTLTPADRAEFDRLMFASAEIKRVRLERGDQDSSARAESKPVRAELQRLRLNWQNPYSSARAELQHIQEDMDRALEAISANRFVFARKGKHEATKGQAWFTREVIRELLFAEVAISDSTTGAAVCCVEAVLTGQFPPRDGYNYNVRARDLVRAWIADSGYSTGKVLP